MIRGGTTYRFISDERGSPRLVIDSATGEIAQRLNYDAYGRVVEDTNPGFQPFGFNGGLYDRDTGLTLLGQRQYDARTGRFTTKDPAGFGGGDTNLYAFAAGDPINAVDPTGQSIFGDAVGFMGDIVGGAGNVASSVGNVVTTAVNAAPDAAAGTLHGLSGGISTKIAGRCSGLIRRVRTSAPRGASVRASASPAACSTAEESSGPERRSLVRRASWPQRPLAQPRSSARP